MSSAVPPRSFSTPIPAQPEHVVVTGAGAGVGRAVVREFARHGAHLSLLGRDPERLTAARRDIEEAGGRALELPTDIAHAAQVEAAAEAAEAAFGPVDIWINCAMVTVMAPIHELTPEELQRVTQVTYLGTAFGTMSALRRMRARGQGTIVQVGSALAYRSIPLQGAYCAAKHAVKGLTESLRSELLHDKVNVHLTMVQLPALNTPQFEWLRSHMPNKAQPVPPIFQPEVAARAIYWAAHHHRREVFVGGSTVKAIWMEKWLPAGADRVLARAGYEEQQTDEPETPGRPDNLWRPVPGRFAAHGRFDERAHAHSAQLWWTTHRNELLVGGALGGLALAWGWRGAGHSPRELKKPLRRLLRTGAELLRRAA